MPYITILIEPFLQEILTAAEVVEARLVPLQDALEVASAGAVLARLAAARSQEDSGNLN